MPYIEHSGFTSSFSATTAEYDVTLTHYDNFLPIITATIIVVECAFRVNLFEESVVLFLYRFLVRIKNVERQREEKNTLARRTRGLGQTLAM